jgi:hypothetical protein
MEEMLKHFVRVGGSLAVGLAILGALLAYPHCSMVITDGYKVAHTCHSSLWGSFRADYEWEATILSTLGGAVLGAAIGAAVGWLYYKVSGKPRPE